MTHFSFQSNIFSTLLMLYFAGSHLSIMSVMLCAIMVSGPVKAFLGFRSSFKVFDDALPPNDPMLRQSKIVYLLINAGVLAIGVWKIGQLGILPFTEADYLRSSPVFTSDGAVPFERL